MLKSIALIAVGGLAARFVFAFFPAGLSVSQQSTVSFTVWSAGDVVFS